MRDINSVATELQRRLLDAGFIIQRYDAYSTNSIYLKLDYGVCNSIRISDHKGKEHLNYMFNLDRRIKKIRIERGEYTRYYYPFTEITAMVRKILDHRAKKQEHYGSSYAKVVQEAYLKNQHNKGFWREAVLVTSETVSQQQITSKLKQP